jgi:hypothetical protein
MPPGPRAALVTRLKDRHDELVRAALAELVTFVLLKAVYPAVEIEPETGTGSKTDFAVDLPVRTHFEVYRKAPPKAQTAEAVRLAAISAELEKIESPDFWLDVDPQSGVKVPAMGRVRKDVEQRLAALDYEEQVQRRDQEQEARRERLAGEVPGLDASPFERARYLAVHQPFQPESFEYSGEGWSVKITANPRAADARGPGQFTVGLRSAGEAHIENPEGLGAAVRDKLKQHSGLADPLVLVLDLSSPIIDDRELAAMFYGSVTTAILDLVTVIDSERDRSRGVWPEPVRQPSRPAAVLILRGIWLDCHNAAAELWLPPGVDSPILPGAWNVWTLGPDGQLTGESASLSIAEVLS